MSRHRNYGRDKNKEEGKESLSRHFTALSRQSSKKNVKPHCRNKLATKAEGIGAAYMLRHFTTLSQQKLLESNINNCRDKQITKPDDKEGCSNVATLP